MLEDSLDRKERIFRRRSATVHVVICSYLSLWWRVYMRLKDFRFWTVIYPVVKTYGSMLCSTPRPRPVGYYHTCYRELIDSRSQYYTYFEVGLYRQSYWCSLCLL